MQGLSVRNKNISDNLSDQWGLGNCMDIQKELDQTVRLISIFGASSNGNELCRRVASDELFGIGTIGIQLYALTNSGRWQVLGSYGKVALRDERLSQFDENVLTIAARSRKVEIVQLEVDGELVEVAAAIFLRDNMPVGAMLRVYKTGSYLFNPPGGTLRAIQDSGGLFLDSIGYRTIAASEDSRDASPQDLTERQMQILIDMAQGKTNLVIAQQMILSESTIKQESVRIFRALGVGTRQQAVLKARTLGLLPDGIEIKV
jgi:DNA-binding CsgD family transcriptional regulator